MNANDYASVCVVAIGDNGF